MFDFDLARLAAAVPAILIALAFHELAHGLAATYYGDPTPRMQGRLTVNPFPHLDPVGTLMILLTQLGVAPIGWAKPVETNPAYFRTGNKLRAMMWVAAAGPTMNFLLAIVGFAAYKLLYGIPEARALLDPFVRTNLGLAAFNLAPIPPLDGSKVLAGLLPGRQGMWLYQLEQYGPIILLILIVTGLSQYILMPIYLAVKYFFSLIVGFLPF